VPFEFYISEKLQNNPKVVALIKQSEELYFELLENGVNPQEARRIIPQAGSSQIWGAFQPTQLAHYFRLRDDALAQW
ncbi:FAD-dependent thymidylate synthase, partial [Aliarcobacter butzleri]|uniref:FAD-dependent thymidylate synthase n=1 Tax=Aliarcobacter butzleri TaxID=28197 RepID=UPI003AF8A1E6